ncbi:hypothetical protein NEHOM01_1908 [Nematocida homosporus]|uniref:uncharacterized protein n=1 Tax=Nematocida homosporus TaxID=1912981 RepID=UPI00221F8359|nr:uncharacterized protein NEHOM01_1908 [Nematocida homosporus]KAI5187069.1 hypothetical protein NEHOM01_1908 [Nematocida homosporus]
MSLSLKITKPIIGQIMNKPRSRLVRFFVPNSLIRRRSIAIFAPTAHNNSIAMTKDLKVVGHWLTIGIYVLLVLLTSVCASNAVVKSIDKAGLAPQSIKDISRIMRRIGFTIDNKSDVISVNHYNSSHAAQEFPDTNLMEHRPSYIVNYSDIELYFRLPKYSDVEQEQAQADLNQLRKIALINATCVYIYSKTLSRACYQTSLQILSRVVNMIDCAVLEIRLTPNMCKNLDASQINWDIIQQEALNTVNHTPYLLSTSIRFWSRGMSKLSRLIDSGIVLLRPISNILLTGNEISNTPLLIYLPLADRYTLTFGTIYKPFDINISSLQDSPSECQSITIIGSLIHRIKLIGLENAHVKHPTLALRANWEVLLHLGKNNGHLIQVNTLLGMDIIPQTLQAFSQNLVMLPNSVPCISAILISSKISTIMPCGPLKQYSVLYTQNAYVQLGFVVKEIQIEYENNRSDLLETMVFFHEITALSTTFAEVVVQCIRCCGEALSVPGWTVQETVNIKLNHEFIEAQIKRYTDIYPYFCQNIRYTAITIYSDNQPNESSVQMCIRILGLFWNITADELKIVNVRSSSNTSCNFKMDLLDKDMCYPTWAHLNIKKIVLDNIDMRIIYRLLSLYEFAVNVELFILNQHFTNLAIAQILSQPTIHNINRLTINDFYEIDEVVKYHHQDDIEDFSLFKYVNTAKQEGKTIKEIGLHKMALQLTDVNFDLYRETLYKLLSCGIQIIDMPLNWYLECSTTFHSQAILLDKQEFTIRNVVLSALEIDLITSQTQTSLPHDSSHLVQKQSVERLFLHFDHGQTLTEANLATIIRWIGYRFKGTTTLHISNINLSKSTQNLILTRNYLIIYPDTLTTIQIESKDPSTSPISMQVHPYYASLLANITNPNPTFTAVSSTTLIQLLPQAGKFLNNCPDSIGFSLTFKSILTHLMSENNQIPGIECTICTRVFYIPHGSQDTGANVCIGLSKDSGELSKDSEGVDEDSENSGPKAKRPRLMFDPDNEFLALCYLKCGHVLCNTCATQIQQDNRCPNCRHPQICQDIHQLISIPQANFISVTDSTNLHPFNPTQPNPNSTTPTQIYLYLAHQHTSHLKSFLNKTATTSSPYYIHII